MTQTTTTFNAYDDLLDCLVELTRWDKEPYSHDALRAGLALIDNRLSPESFVRAAKKAGYSTKVIERPIERVSNLVLPGIAILADNHACLVKKINLSQGTLEVFLPDKQSHEVLAIEDFSENYQGIMYLLKKDFNPKLEPGFKSQSQDKKHWFWSTLWLSRKIYRDVLLASILINVFALIGPLFTMNVYDRVVPNHAESTLWVLSVGVVIIYGFDFLFKSLRSHFLEIASKKSDILLSSRIFERVMNLRMSSAPKSAGSFAQMLKEFDAVRNFVTSTTMTVLVDIPFVIIFIFVIWVIGGPLVLVPLVIIPVMLFYSFYAQRKLQSLIAETNQANARRSGLLIEALSNMESIKTMNAEGVMQSKWERDVSFLANKGVGIRNMTNTVGYVAGFFQQVVTVVTVVMGVYLIYDQELSMGALIASVMLMGRAIGPIAQVSKLVVQYQQSKQALQTLNDIMHMPVEREDGSPFVHRSEFSGHFEFKDVSFSYCDDCVSALDKVSFSIKPGEKVGVIGKMGSGKTTVEKLMVGLFQAKSGSVLLDGVDLNQIDPVDLRRNIGFVPQDVSLFKGTLRENIALRAPYVDDQMVLQAAEIAGVTSFSNHHPRGLEMEIDERGSSLSGGQRQAVVVARALINNPKIIIMDEPSNSMDNTTEARLKKSLETYIKDKTFVIVTHKASMLALVERLIVIDNGRLIADGPRDQVLNSLKSGRVATQE